MAIWLLAFPIGQPFAVRPGPQPTAPARIAERLGVSRASVGEMLGKLEQRRLVRRGERKEALLTPAGQRRAMAALRRRRLVERFLVDELGFELWELGEHAGPLADGFTDEPLDRLYERLGRPERCPHGYPIDPDHELRENATLEPLGALGEGDSGVVVRIVGYDAALQQRLAAAGVEPGAKVSVAAVHDGQMEVEAAGGGRVVVDAAAPTVAVRRAGTPEVPAQSTCWADIVKRERDLA